MIHVIRPPSLSTKLSGAPVLYIWREREQAARNSDNKDPFWCLQSIHTTYTMLYYTTL